jgi:serine phosphatase RsbU (regulator of sigma subunit)
LNEAILHQHSDLRFVTAVHGCFSTGTERVSVLLALAGHPSPIVIRAAGGAEFAGEPGMLLGVDTGLDVHETGLHLEPGDTLLVYTDGLTEAQAPARLLEPDELLAIAGSLAGRSAGDIADALVESALSADVPGRDDIALLVLRAA